MTKKLSVNDQEEKLIMCLRETGFEVKEMLEIVKDVMGKNHSAITKKIGSEKDKFMAKLLQGVADQFEKNHKLVSEYISQIDKDGME